jgi:hypothetical protein
MEMKGTIIDVPLPMRSLVVRGIPKDADLAAVLKCLPGSVDADQLEHNELRDDARGYVLPVLLARICVFSNRCALLAFKNARECIQVHMEATNVRFADDQDKPTPVYVLAAGK